MTECVTPTVEGLHQAADLCSGYRRGIVGKQVAWFLSRAAHALQEIKEPVRVGSADKDRHVASWQSPMRFELQSWSGRRGLPSLVPNTKSNSFIGFEIELEST
jgi:hypothetical protein